jgi:hypothetical protein
VNLRLETDQNMSYMSCSGVLYSCQLGQGQCTMGTNHVSPCPIVLLVLTEEALGQTSAQYLI